MLILYSRFDETLTYAIEEFTKYAERMSDFTLTVTSRHVPVLPKENVEGAIRFGLLSDFGLDDSCVKDALVDDVLDIDVRGDTGYIAGSNIRSILLGVYRYFRSAGARWLRPGDDGEIIPTCDLLSHAFRYRHEASYRYRGECIEGAISYEHVRDTVIWAPKVMMNMFFMEQIIPYNYISRWYDHTYNPKYPADPRTFEMVGEYTHQLELLIKKCGLQLHALGHGYMLDRYGIHYRTWHDQYEVSELAKSHCALVKGERGLFHGSPNFTQLCFSNPEARRGMVEFCADYLVKKPYIDFLHVWLADATNNHCECDECRKKTPSDFYVMFLNELDAELIRRGIQSRIVFILYTDTVFPPETEKLKVSDRFVLLTAFGRDYSVSYTDERYEGELPVYRRNNYNVPADFRIKYAFYQKWREQFKGSAFLYEYYFYTDHFNDPGYNALIRVIAEDVRRLGGLGFEGIVSDQTQRSFYPNGLPLSLLAEALYDRGLDENAYADDYYRACYGSDWEAAKAYLVKMSELFDPPLLRTKRTPVEQDTGMYRTVETFPWRDNPEAAVKFAQIPAVAAAFRPVAEKNAVTDDPTMAKNWNYLALHTAYVAEYAAALEAGARGDMDAARRLYESFKEHLMEDEGKWAHDFDLCLFIQNSSAKFR